MTDRIQKLLRNLDKKQRGQLVRLIELVRSGKIAGLDVKKLQGRDDVCRVRRGDFRIIYQHRDDQIMILAVERRSDATYS